MTTKKSTPKRAAKTGATAPYTYPRNPLTLDEVKQLARSISLRIDAREATDLLLLCHAFTFEESKAEREGMLQQVKEASAWLFPAFDAMVAGEIARGLAELKEGGAR